MTAFPTTLSSEPIILNPSMYSDRKGYLRTLNERGFGIQLLMTPQDVLGIQALARQASIKRYCFRDPTDRRFGATLGDIAPAERWMQKGRLPFLLKKLGHVGNFAGYGWSGPETCEDFPLDGDTTCAVRLNEEYQGQGLAAPFLGIVTDYTMEAYGSKMWIEAWQSNLPGVHMDKKVGYVIRGSKPGLRPIEDGTEEDVRLFMDFPEAA